MISRVLSAALLVIPTASRPAAEKPPKERTFLFTYRFEVTGLPKGKQARIWFPLVWKTSEQGVNLVSTKSFSYTSVQREKMHRTWMVYKEATIEESGTITFSLPYRITRKEVRGFDGRKPEDLKRYLKANRLVPIDGKPLDLLKGKKLPSDNLEKVKALYQIVLDHMKYDKTGKGWGLGDSVHACETGRGNCTDFHSLFISLARSQKIPARFEIGFSIPSDKKKGTITGYHCWSKFYIEGKGWIPVDISEASKHPKKKDYYFGNLDENRVTMSIGRDLILSPPQKGMPLNYFVYPYVEVDGKPWPGDKIKKSFSYEDVKPKGK